MTTQAPHHKLAEGSRESAVGSRGRMTVPESYRPSAISVPARCAALDGVYLHNAHHQPPGEPPRVSGRISVMASIQLSAISGQPEKRLKESRE
jgi:hypothetical protein